MTFDTSNRGQPSYNCGMDEQQSFDYMYKRFKEVREQNAALVEALDDSDELIDRLKGNFGDWWGGSRLAHKTVEIQQANKQALARAESTND